MIKVGDPVRFSQQHLQAIKWAQGKKLVGKVIKIPEKDWAIVDWGEPFGTTTVLVNSLKRIKGSVQISPANST